MDLLSKKWLAVGSVLTAAAFAQPRAEAATVIELSDGIAPPVVVFDGGIGDLSAVPGVVVFSGAVGVFNVNVTTGLSFPLLGSATTPVMDLNSVNVSSGGVGTLTVKLTTTDFIGVVPVGSATLDAGGTTNGSIAIDSFVHLGNAPFGTMVPTGGTIGSPIPAPFSGSTASATPLSPLYSATIIASIVHDTPGDVTSFDAEYRIVPEPGSIALLAIGAGMLGYRRRRQA